MHIEKINISNFGLKKLLWAVVLLPIFLVPPPTTIPAKVALSTAYENIGTDSPIEVIKKIIKAETAMMIELKKKYEPRTIPAKYCNGNPATHIDVTF